MTSVIAGAGRRPTAPPSAPSRTASVRNCAAMCAPGRAERAAQADLGPAFEYGDDHDVRDPDAADEQRDGAEAERTARWTPWRRRAARSARPTAG